MLLFTRRRRGHLGDRPMPTGGGCASEHGLSRRRAQCRRVEPVQPDALFSHPVGDRGGARTAEGRRGTEPNVVEQHDQHVRCPGGRTQLLDRRVGRVGVLGVMGRQTDMLNVGDGQMLASQIEVCRRHARRSASCCSGTSSSGTLPLLPGTMAVPRLQRRCTTAGNTCAKGSPEGIGAAQPTPGFYEQFPASAARRRSARWSANRGSVRDRGVDPETATPTATVFDADFRAPARLAAVRH